MSQSDNSTGPSGTPLSTSFYVQGRLIERRGSAVIRDETRHADTDSRGEALRIAQMLVGDGFTVWIWAVDARSVPARWKLVARIDPPEYATDRHRERTAGQGGARNLDVGAA